MLAYLTHYTIEEALRRAKEDCVGFNSDGLMYLEIPAIREAAKRGREEDFFKDKLSELTKRD